MNIEEVKEYIIKNGLHYKNRKRHIVDQRAYLCYYLRMYDLSYAQIGKLFNQYHATVLHAVRKYDNLKGTIGYAINVKDLIYQFPISQDIKKTLYKSKTIVIRVSPDEYLKLQAYRTGNDIKSNEEALSSLINSIGDF